MPELERLKPEEAAVREYTFSPAALAEAFAASDAGHKVSLTLRSSPSGVVEEELAVRTPEGAVVLSQPAPARGQRHNT